MPVATCRTSVEDLERAAALGWRATETARVGEWLLRAAGGFTGRANSALALGDPGVPVAEAVDRVAAWYAERGLRPLFLLPTPSRYAPALDGELDRRGWTHGDEVRVLVAPVAPAAAVSDRTVTAGGVRAVVTAQPGEGWLACYHYRGGDLPPHAREVVARGDVVGFVALVDAGRVVAVARGSVDSAADGTPWLGVTAVEVDPSVRRRGLGSRVMREVVAWGAARGACCCYLQVAVENAPALEMYAALGFEDHHRYHYRSAPDG